MPFLDSSKRTICMTEALDAISMIETIVLENPQHSFVIGGDLNTELIDQSPFDPLWKNFAAKNRFAYCRNRFQGPPYTYHHESLGQKKLNDHFLVSQNLMDSNLLTNMSRNFMKNVQPLELSKASSMGLTLLLNRDRTVIKR